MQEVKTVSCWSRFATRCLKLRGATKSGRGKRKQSAVVKLPGEDLTEEELTMIVVPVRRYYPASGRTEHVDEERPSYPFSDTEEEVAAMNRKHRKLRAEVHEWMGGDHVSPDGHFEFLWDGQDLIDGCFKAAVGRLLPEHSSDFEFHVMSRSTDYFTGYTSDNERAYISYTPCKATHWHGDGPVNVPVGHNSTLTTLTAVPTLSDAQRATVNTSLAVLVDRLGLTAVGEPGFKLVSTTSDG